ncbi:hypothetical protein A8C56_17315 [Niabella ginsenosidivorans]|uniref:Uncharacterized protein n=1 Tax=Niabella ginsenosidivorans TaxID=1176587 RepID=A0A1A9I589_9BACT|nr:hypothetical protein [Niabella ginsenosidivorans]ANH82495.1 hypothetical protein A8C56_17315 [Niabella ginsenosidivorans]
MLKLLTTLCCLLFSLYGSAQPDHNRMSDYISVKKKNGRTIDNYYPGMQINFITADGIQYEGPIDHIKNDSIFVQFFQVLKRPTIWGTYIPDTIKNYTIPYYYKDIKNIVTSRTLKRRGYLNTLGAILKIGGGGYAILSIVNSLGRKEAPFAGQNGTNLAIAAGVFGAGYYMGQKFKSFNKISKRSKIVYVNMQ